MALYALYHDLVNYTFIGFDEKQIIDLCGNNPREGFDFHGIRK